MEGFPSSHMIQLKSGTADVLRQYGILRLCFFTFIIRQFNSLTSNAKMTFRASSWLDCRPVISLFFLRKYIEEPEIQSLTQAMKEA